MATFVGISIVTGIAWRRANRWGAAASLLAAFSTNFFHYHWKNERLDYWDPNIFLAALTAGILSLVSVSLYTRPEPESNVARFIARLQTPTDLAPRPSADSANPIPDGDQRTPGLTAVASRWAAENGRQLLLTNLLHLRGGACGGSLFQAYRDDLKGLLIGSALSVGLVIDVWALLQA